MFRHDCILLLRLGNAERFGESIRGHNFLDATVNTYFVDNKQIETQLSLLLTCLRFGLLQLLFVIIL